jgi:hypothetical protein
MFSFLFDPEDGSNIFLRDVRLSPNFTVLETRKTASCMITAVRAAYQSM